MAARCGEREPLKTVHPTRDAGAAISPPPLVLVAVSRLQAVLAAAFARGFAPGAGGPHLAWVTEACRLLADPAFSAMPMREIAKRLGMSHERFRKRFTQTVGLSPAHYRARCVIHRAQELLQHGSLTSQEIATQLGFCHEYYVSRRSKQLTDISPRLYRQRLIEPPASMPVAMAH